MTGNRQGELNGLQAKNINFESMEIKIETAWKRKTKKLGKTKTKIIRVIPMAQPLADLLMPLVKACKSPNDRIFGWDNADYTYRLYSDVLKKLGLDFTGHIMRHTFITNAFEFGFPPYLVQQWVGHADALQTQKYLGLRRASEYIETEITEYMKLLKTQTVLNV
jgi:integrase